MLDARVPPFASTTIVGIVLAFGPSPVAFASDPSAAWTFDVRAGDVVVGRETVRAEGDVLRWAGRLSLGTSWWHHAGEARRGSAGLSWLDEGDTPGGSYRAEGQLPGGGPANGAEDGVIVSRYGRFAGLAALASRLVPLGEGAVGHRVARVDQHTRERSEWRVTAAWRFHVGDRTGWRFELEDDAGARAGLLAGTDGEPWRVAAHGLDALRTGTGFEGLPPASLRSTEVDDGPWRALLSPAEHSIRHDDLELVPMRDGVRLATDVYRPSRDGRYPTVLVRTPYHRWTEAAIRPAAFVPRGYAVVVQDVRGRGESEGRFDPLVHEEEDGVATLDWISAQPWSDGNVGMIGNSYVGWVQVLLAKSAHPSLKAIVPIVCPPDPEENFPYEGGAPHLAIAWWAAVMDSMDEGGIFGGVPSIPWNDVLGRLPLAELDDAVETRHAFVDEWLRHPPHDDAYWAPRRHEHAFDRMRVAGLHVTGWFDGDQPGAPRNFLGLRERAATDEARRGQFLLVGPWGHAANTARMLGRRDFGEKALIDLDALVLRFFDRYLKGVENGVEHDAPVRLFLIGEDRWVAADDWPPSSTSFEPLHLSSGGHAARRDGDGVLLADRPAGPAAADTFRDDPADPRPTTVDFDDLLGESELADWSALEDRDDVLDYTSRPLAAPLDLLGPVTAHVSFSTDAPDEDVCVELLAVRPDGTSVRIAGGIQRLRYAEDPRRDRPQPAGEVHEVVVDCWAVSRSLEAGDRLRVQVSGSLWPWYGRNLHTLESPFTATEGRIATNRVHHGGAHASRIVLPVRGAPPRFE